MIQHHSRRRADRGTLTVRASVVALGLATSVGLQLSESASQGPAIGAAGRPSSVMCTDANASFAFQ